MKKLRLLITERCNKSCTGCCNKDWKLDELLTFDPFTLSLYDEVLITGGEPTLNKVNLLNVLNVLNKDKTDQRILMYTNGYDPFLIASLLHLDLLDGVTLTLHEPSDIANFVQLQELLRRSKIKGKSLRLNVFEGVPIEIVAPHTLIDWVVKDEIVWKKDCPLPDNEVFMKF